jgi:hypothetical protein
MKFAAKIITVCMAAGLLVQAAISAPFMLVVPQPPKPPTLQAALWASFSSATNARPGTTQFANMSTLNPTFDTNSVTFGLTGYNACAAEANPAPGFVWTNQTWYIPVTALTRRHVYYRGHSTGGTNGQFMPTGIASPLHFIRTDGSIYLAYVAGVKKGLQDYNVAILSNDLPADIQPMMMADPNALAEKLAKNPVGFWPNFKPLLGYCQHNKIGTIDGVSFNPHNFYVGGDSGSPDFYILNGALVFVEGRTTSGWCPQMQADCDQLTTWAGLNPAQYQIALLDLSQFSDF